MYLFVCLANVNRSPRAAEIFQKLCRDRGIDAKVESAGVEAWPIRDPDASERIYGIRKTTQLTQRMVKEAKAIFALDASVCETILSDYPDSRGKLFNLGVPDRFSKHQGNLNELYTLLKAKLHPYVQAIEK